MTTPFIASIIEGKGEEDALPKLIYNVVLAVTPDSYPIVLRPHRIPKDRLLTVPGLLEYHCERAVAEAGPNARLIVMLDADDGCPAELGPRLHQRIVSRFPRERFSVNIANREYENWFIASLETIAGEIGVSQDTQVPDNIESIRGAKEWLSRRMPSGATYRPRLHQVELSSAVDVPLARSRSQSFDRFCREVERLLRA